MQTYKIVFSGDVLPGHEHNNVKARLVALLRVSPEKTDALFSGKRFVLKTGLDEQKAQAYRRKLASMGIGVRVEAESDASTAAMTSATPAEITQQTPPTPSPALALEPMAPTQDADQDTADVSPPPDAHDVADEIECPECGRRQPRRNLCIACGVDMPRVAAAQAQAAEETRYPADASITIHDSPQDDEYEDERPPYFGLSFEGRFGRRSYFVGGALVGVVTGLLAMLTALLGHTGGMLLLIPVLVASMVFSTRTTVLRFHDFNWSGWWAVLLAIPGVGMVVALLLLFMPGTRHANDYGYRTKPTPWLHAGALIALVAVVGIMFASTALKAYSQYAERARQAASPQSLVPSNYNRDNDQIVMYTQSKCGQCLLKRGEFMQMGIEFDERAIDTDTQARNDLISALAEIGHRGQVIMPVVVVNGYVLTNNPPMTEIVTYFGQ